MSLAYFTPLRRIGGKVRINLLPPRKALTDVQLVQMELENELRSYVSLSESTRTRLKNEMAGLEVFPHLNVPVLAAMLVLLELTRAKKITRELLDNDFVNTVLNRFVPPSAPNREIKVQGYKETFVRYLRLIFNYREEREKGFAALAESYLITEEGDEQ